MGETLKRGGAVVVAALLAVLLAALVAGGASAALPARQEAEMTPNVAAGARYTDAESTPAGASPNSWRFTGNIAPRHIFDVADGERVTQIAVRAKLGDDSASGVTLTAAVDGTALDARTLTTASDKRYREFLWAVDMGPGRHTIGVRGTDFQTGDKLIYDWVELRGADGGTVADNQFHLDCGIHEVATIDPIRPDMDHLHALAGNRSLSDDSTYESLLNNYDTSCEQPFVTSAYWAPAVWFGDKQWDPYKISVYYHAARSTDPDLHQIPDGIKVLATNTNGAVTFKCGKDPTTDYTSPSGIYGCTQDFRIGYNFPECWDGQSLEPESVTDANDWNRCPAGTERFVSIRLSFHYDNPNGIPLKEPLTVSTGMGMRGDWTTIHADAFEANQQPVFNDTIRECVMEQQPLPICDRATP